MHPPFFKKEGLAGSQYLEGVAGNEGGGFQVLPRNKLQSEIFNEKKSLSIKMSFSTITKNLNWEILTKNLLDSLQI